MRVRASIVLGVVLLNSFGASFIATPRTEAQTKSSSAQSRIPRQLPAPMSERLRLYEQFVITQMKKDRIPGLTIGFSRNGVTWVRGFGYSDVENKTPAKPESAYRLASITKTMTGTAILQLVERGKIKLDEEIQTYVPYYPRQKWPVTA